MHELPLAVTSDELRNLVLWLWHAALEDPLTGALNLRAYQMAEREQARPFVASVDLDDFGEVNKRGSQSAGDELLRHVVGALRAESAEAYRVGGDEFLVRHDDANQLVALLARVAERLAALEFSFALADGTTYQRRGVTFRYGIGRTRVEADAGLVSAKRKRSEQATAPSATRSRAVP